MVLYCLSLILKRFYLCTYRFCLWIIKKCRISCHLLVFFHIAHLMNIYSEKSTSLWRAHGTPWFAEIYLYGLKVFLIPGPSRHHPSIETVSRFIVGGVEGALLRQYWWVVGVKWLAQPQPSVAEQIRCFGVFFILLSLCCWRPSSHRTVFWHPLRRARRSLNKTEILVKAGQNKFSKKGRRMKKNVGDIVDAIGCHVSSSSPDVRWQRMEFLTIVPTHFTDDERARDPAATSSLTEERRRITRKHLVKSNHNNNHNNNDANNENQ